MPGWMEVYASIGIFYAVLLGTLSLAFAIGGSPEKRGALVIVAMIVWQFAAYFVVPPHYAKTDFVAVISDGLGLLGFGMIGINAKRVWPLWASAFQLMSMSGHFARWVELSFDPIIYSWMKSLPTGGAILALLAGTLFHIRRLHRSGTDPSWQDWASIERRASIRRHLMSSRP